MQIRRGDVVEVDLGAPSDDDTRGNEIYKRRPAVVIQNDAGNVNSDTTIVAPISSGHSGYPFHVTLPAATPGLDHVSHVMLEQIRTVDIEARIVAHHGSLTDEQMGDVDEAIEVSLGL